MTQMCDMISPVKIATQWAVIRMRGVKTILQTAVMAKQLPQVRLQDQVRVIVQPHKTFRKKDGTVPTRGIPTTLNLPTNGCSSATYMCVVRFQESVESLTLTQVIYRLSWMWLHATQRCLCVTCNGRELWKSCGKHRCKGYFSRMRG